MLKTKIASVACAAALFGTVATGAVAGQQQTDQRGGATGLVAAVLNVNVTDAVDIAVIDSFNNLRALNNVLNNSPILSNNDIDIAVGDIAVLQNFLNDAEINVNIQDVLNDLMIDIDDVVAIGILDGQDVIIFL